MKYFNTLIFFIIFSTILIAQQQTWPFLNNAVGGITGTPGENRRLGGDPNNTTNLRLHGGLDIIPSGASVRIYSVTGGPISWNPHASASNPNATNAWRSVITVGDYQYKHVKIRSNVFNADQQIGANIHIGDLMPPVGNFTSPHVHMIGVNETLNYQLLLNPYSDTEDPTFWDYENDCWVGSQGCSDLTNEVEVLSFFTDGIDNDNEPNTGNNGILREFGGDNMPDDVSLEFSNTDDIEHTVIFDRVDFMARVRDDRVNADGTGGGHNCAPTLIGYEIFDIREQSVFNNQNAVDFRTLIANNFPAAADNPANTLFGNNTSCCGSLDYILTTNIHSTNNTVDRYWNTKLRDGVTETWTSDNTLCSICPQEAEFPDGRYKINVETNDIFNTVDYDVPLVIDNFKPFVQKIELFFNNNAAPFFENEWECNREVELMLINNCGDQLISVPFYPRPFPSDEIRVKIPTRTNTGWSVAFPSGTETAHHFSLPTPPFCPKDARLDDGEYEINGDSVVIDNFLPFVERVQISSHGELLYDRWWSCNDDNTGVYLNISDNTVTDLNLEYRLLRFYFEKRKNRERKLCIHFKCNQDSQRYIQCFCQCRDSTQCRIQKPSLNTTDL